MQTIQASSTTASELDLDRYFARIGYTGTPRADLETLRALTELHPASIPFEAVDVLLGRVLWMLPQDAPPVPLTHMALRVTIDGERWLADVGFSSCIAGAPLRFDAFDAEQPTRHETFRLTRRGAWTLLERLA